MSAIVFNPHEFYTMIIVNQSGADSSYSIFPEKFSVDPPPAGEITSTVINNIFAPHGFNAATNIPRTELYAVCGTMAQGPDNPGLETQVLGSRAVTLGAEGADGSLQAFGSAVGVTKGGGSLFFQTVPLPLSLTQKAGSGQFLLQTSDDFTPGQAKEAGFVVGTASSQHQLNAIGPNVKFCPGPSMVYLIKPSMDVFVSKASYPAGTWVTKKVQQDMDYSSCKVSFSSQQPRITVVHNEFGVLVVQTSQS